MPKDVSHYTQGSVECIDYIYDQLGSEGGLYYCLGNILKYATRAKHKGQLVSDLKKIEHYAQLALERVPEEEPHRFDRGGMLVPGPDCTDEDEGEPIEELKGAVERHSRLFPKYRSK